jgi:transcriptional regulator with XRE-family HTH domain
MMLNTLGVAPEERGKLVLKWRTTLGWNVGEAAKRVGVSTRTISAIESGAQVMPDSRWRLFTHEVLAEINREHRHEMVVVLSDWEPQTPLDVVSSDNYAGYALGDDGETALIASYSINRQSGAPEVHRQRFLVKSNPHVIRAIERWEAARQEATPNRAAFEMQRWLMRRVLAGELRNPELTQLKAAINEATEKLDQASNESAEIRTQLMRKLDVAIADLMEAVARATKK